MKIYSKDILLNRLLDFPIKIYAKDIEKEDFRSPKEIYDILGLTDIYEKEKNKKRKKNRELEYSKYDELDVQDPYCWKPEDLKKVVTHSMGLLNFMDGAEGVISYLNTPPNVTRLLSKYYPEVKIDSKTGLLDVGNRKIKVNKFLQSEIKRIEKGMQLVPMGTNLVNIIFSVHNEAFGVLLNFLNTITFEFEYAQIGDKRFYNLPTEADINSSKSDGLTGMYANYFDVKLKVKEFQIGTVFLSKSGTKAISLEPYPFTIDSSTRVEEEDIPMKRAFPDGVTESQLNDLKYALETSLHESKGSESFKYKITTAPSDVLTMSYGKNWGSCMSPGGAAYLGPLTDVLAGSAVMYFYSVDEEKTEPVGRIILRPAVDNGQPVVLVSPVTYGFGPLMQEDATAYNAVFAELKTKFPQITFEEKELTSVTSLYDMIYDDSAKEKGKQSDTKEQMNIMKQTFNENNLLVRDPHKEVRDEIRMVKAFIKIYARNIIAKDPNKTFPTDRPKGEWDEFTALGEEPFEGDKGNSSQHSKNLEAKQVDVQQRIKNAREAIVLGNFDKALYHLKMAMENSWALSERMKNEDVSDSEMLRVFQQSIFNGNRALTETLIPYIQKRPSDKKIINALINALSELEVNFFSAPISALVANHPHTF
jgi:hypothetical protein